MSATAMFDEVLHRLGAAIVSGELPAGTRMRLVDIEERGDVSRTLARDVVQALAAVGMVETRRKAGIVVQPRRSWLALDPLVIGWRLEYGDRTAQIASLTEVREAIEPRAARLAALRATGDQAKRLVILAETLESLGNRGLAQSNAFLAADLEYHDLLLEASGNEMLFAMRGMVEEVLRGRATHGLMPDRPDRSSIDEHLNVAKAILSRDPDAAESASRRFLLVVHREMMT